MEPMLKGDQVETTSKEESISKRSLVTIHASSTAPIRKQAQGNPACPVRIAQQWLSRESHCPVCVPAKR